MEWMRTAALPGFRKLYGRVEADLGAGELLAGGGGEQLQLVQLINVVLTSLAHVYVINSSEYVNGFTCMDYYRSNF